MFPKGSPTLMSSRSRKLRMMPFLFQMIGGRSVPWMAHVRTALRPTVTVETLVRWSSARLSCTTSVARNGGKTVSALQLPGQKKKGKCFEDGDKGCERTSQIKGIVLTRRNFGQS